MLHTEPGHYYSPKGDDKKNKTQLQLYIFFPIYVTTTVQYVFVISTKAKITAVLSTSDILKILDFVTTRSSRLHLYTYFPLRLAMVNYKQQQHVMPPTVRSTISIAVCSLKT
jgi:hypothetical protein